MAIDLEKLKARLERAKNGDGKKGFWKIEEGVHVVRIAPTDDGDPFKDYSFHYNVGKNAGFLCPKRNFGEDCPVCEFASKLWREGADGSDDRKTAKTLFPRQRFFAPVLVRGQEDKGVRVWGFGNRAYETLINLVLNPEYGDITDVTNGTDLDVKYETAKGDRFPTTTITPKRKASKFCEDQTKAECKELLETGPDLESLFDRKSTNEVEAMLNDWLHDGDDNAEGKPEVEKYGNKKTEAESDGEENPVDRAFDELLND